VTVDGESVATVELPFIESSGVPAGTTVPVDLDLPEPTTGSRFRLTFRRIDARVADDAVFGDPVPPVAIAEVGLPGPTVPVRDGRFDSGCRDDLLTVAGDPVGVRVTGTTEDALAGRALAVALCGDDRSGLELGGGRTRLATTRGDAVGIDIDQLVLRSAAGGTASDAGTTLVTEAAPGSGAGADLGTPEVEVVRDGDAGLRLRVSGAEPGTPFWLVLGQSYSDGWAATVQGSGGSRVAERPELVDGFANGWLVTPDEGSFEVTLAFTPQATVARAQWLSLLAGLACVALALRPARRRVALPVGAGTGPEAGTAPVAGINGRAARPFDPLPRPLTLAPALRYRGDRPPAWAVALVALAVGGLGWVLAGLPVGVVVGAAAAAGTVHPGARRWILAGAPAALALAAVWVCTVQLLRNPEPGLDWPRQMRAVHPLGWLAALLPVVDLVVGAARRCAHARYAKLAVNRTSSRDSCPETDAPDAGDEGSADGSQQAVLVEST
jgi:hypothetical protein